jgi:hypothetical protein
VIHKIAQPEGYSPIASSSLTRINAGRAAKRLNVARLLRAQLLIQLDARRRILESTAPAAQ